MHKDPELDRPQTTTAVAGLQEYQLKLRILIYPGVSLKQGSLKITDQGLKERNSYRNHVQFPPLLISHLFRTQSLDLATV